MRINVYAEELTDEVRVTSKVVSDQEFGTRCFLGLGFYMASPEALHSSPTDDDRSAVTIWYREDQRQQVRAMLTALLARVG